MDSPPQTTTVRGGDFFREKVKESHAGNEVVRKRNRFHRVNVGIKNMVFGVGSCGCVI